jgi:release factor glutamine methyltransferase
LNALVNPISISNVINYGCTLLQPLPNCRLEAEILLAHVLKCSRAYLYIQDNPVVTPNLFAEYEHLCEQRRQGKPLAYLVGYKEFWSLELEVNEHTLIPRPETELLVEVALAELHHHPSASILDMGVGCGAIAIALAIERPHWNIIGVDCSWEALEVARRNVAKHRLNNVALIASNWFQSLSLHQVDAIISNPPYVANNDPHLSSLKYEPYRALVGGQEGLGAIKIILSQADAYLKKQGLVAFEHGFDQAEKIRSILSKKGYTTIKTHLDLGGNPRVTTAIWK